MCLLFETVKVQHRLLHNIETHNLRMARARRSIFGLNERFDLRNYISLPDDLDDSLYKCRIVYARTVQTVEFQKYIPKPVRTLQIIDDDTIQYEHKYLDRSCFEKLLLSAKADDILIVQKGFVTDVSFANIVFYDGKTWVTPARPLLNGTKRQMLLRNGVIREEEITTKDLVRFTHASVINALLDLQDAPIIPMANIFYP
jgi:4-amino-4-deoxychorismate lyase